MPKVSTARSRSASRSLAGARRTDAARVAGELLSFPAQHLPGLPIAVRFTVHGTGMTHEIVWSTGRCVADPATDALCFDGEELRAIAIAVQAERLWPADLKTYCLRKLHEPNFKVTSRLALDGVQPPDEPPWPLKRVLERLGLQIGDIDCDTNPVATPFRRIVAAA